MTTPSPPAHPGMRLKARRLALGLRQRALAREAGISASYLALIEAGRRPVGGALLGRLARGLGVDPARLMGPEDPRVVAALRRLPGVERAPETPEAFAVRHPDWARAAAAAEMRARAAEGRARAMEDRLAADEDLAAALHEVVDAAAAVRASAAILVDEGLDENWRRRFLRNVGEDADRLAAAAARLTGLIEGEGAAR